MAGAASCGSLNAPGLGLPLKATVPDAKGALPKKMFIGRGPVSAKLRQRSPPTLNRSRCWRFCGPRTRG